MDLNDIRAAVTVFSMLIFLGIVAWAYSSRNRQRFDEIARLPFSDDAEAAGASIKNEGDAR